MNKLKEFFNSYFWLIFIAFLIFVGGLTYSIYSDWQDGAQARTAGTQTGQSNTAVKQAQNANNAAGNFDIERRAEDVIREKTIVPKLNDARKSSNNSKRTLDAARKTYNEKQNDTSNLSASDADNCAKLQRLFPNVRFADCP